MVQLGLGCARLGSAAWGEGSRRSIELVHSAIDHGVLYFDTADAYGSGASETLLGRALAGRCSAVTVASKGGYRFSERGTASRRIRAAGRIVVKHLNARARATVSRTIAGPAYSAQDFSPAYLTTALEASLRRLRTDHIDVYQLHGPRDADPAAIGEWASGVVAQGKIGRLGIGAEDLDQATTWLACPAVTSVQVPFGLLDPAAGADVIPAAHRSGRAVVVRGVLGAGLLADPSLADRGNAHKLPLIEALRAVATETGRTVAALALDFVRARRDIDTVLIGTSSPRHLAEMSAAMCEPLPDPELLAKLDALLAAHPLERL